MFIFCITTDFIIYFTVYYFCNAWVDQGHNGALCNHITYYAIVCHEKLHTST